MQQFKYRTRVFRGDESVVESILQSSNFFSAEEIRVAVELVEENLQKGGEASGYHFVFAETGGEVAGYACFGPVPLTASGWDLYWIAVREGLRGKGLGRRLMAEAERLVAQMGGTRIYIETSMRAQYAPTRAFYESCGYAMAAKLEDFYAPGDSKAIYSRNVKAP